MFARMSALTLALPLRRVRSPVSTEAVSVSQEKPSKSISPTLLVRVRICASRFWSVRLPTEEVIEIASARSGMALEKSPALVETSMKRSSASGR